ncbi:hypothetical protein [Streptomyces sp. NBC_01615]|uniref:hypothetical protein n=1 Tax=Streptomyces sp. NBC_01615 TaxID=2975898 RepID=UPI0038699FA2
MDAAWLGVICGLVGTVTGATVAYFGPLQLERRRARNEREVRAEDRIAVDIGRYVAARAVTDQWLDLLRRAHQAALESHLDLDQFDADTARHSDELRLRLAELAHLGIVEPTTSPSFRTFRIATAAIRRMAVDGGSADRGEPGSVSSLLQACVTARARWALQVLERVSLRTGINLSPQEERIDRGAAS